MRVALFLTCGLLAFAQHASVYDLTVKEQASGQRLFDEMNAATDAYNKWVDAMGAKYLKDGTGTTGCCSQKGHASAVFSEGFRHVMPEPPKPEYHSNLMVGGW